MTKELYFLLLLCLYIYENVNKWWDGRNANGLVKLLFYFIVMDDIYVLGICVDNKIYVAKIEFVNKYENNFMATVSNNLNTDVFNQRQP